MDKARSLSLVLAVVALTTACPRDEPAPPATQPPTEQPPAAAPGETAPPAMAPGAQLPAGVTAQMVSEGQQLYGTVCIACHGAGGVGTPLGPALNDQQWLHIGGEFDEIVNVVAVGVERPLQYPAPMPPRGGGNFTDEQVRSIAAYVYSISHGS